ncbi:MAG: hypothetical protein EOP56_06205 [Sphingobacteriales bacterium]|nr:MAG: hypothetical protein EOP56_06205 [Sphingobacteriales bacterium]
MRDRLVYLKSILLFSVIITILFTSCSSTDDKRDVLISPQLHEAIEVATQKFDSGYTNQSIKFLDSVYESSGYVSVRDRFQYYNFLYDHYNRVNRHNTAKSYVDSMLVLIEYTDNTDEMAAEYAEANYFMGDLLFDEGYYEDAYKYYYKAKTIAKTQKDACRLAYYDYRIGMVLYKDEQFSNAVRSFKQAYFETSACNSDFAFFYRKQEILDNIGLCYYKLDMPDSALVYYHKALYVIDTSCNGYVTSRVRLCNTAKAVIWGNMASAYSALGRKDTAEMLMLSSIGMNSQHSYDPHDAQSTRLKLAALYLEQGRHEEMSKVLNEIKAIDVDHGNKEVQVGYHNLMWQYLKSIGESQAAYAHLSHYVSLSDSIRKVNKNVLLRDIGEGVASLEKQYQIEDLNKQTEVRNISLVIAVLIFVMAAIIFSQLIYTWKKTKDNVQQLTAANAQVKEQKGKLEQVLMELQKADEEKDRILKAVSHDLRSPMNISLSLTELILSERENLSEEQLEYIELIRNSCNNALSLTKELLDVATLNTELMIKEWVDLNEVVSKNVEVLRFRAAEKKQRISMQLPEKSIKLKINRDKVSRVVNNLINNAIKFSPGQSQINIKVHTERRGATISVTDHGIGIPDDLKGKVFDLFTEAKRIGTSGEEPYGLGLSISKQIIDVHGGKIWFDSQVGKGTTFYVYLPDQYNNYVRKV